MHVCWGMKRTGETTAFASISVGSLAAFLKIGLVGALTLGLIVGTAIALIHVLARLRTERVPR